MNEAELLFTETLKCDRFSLYQKRALKLDKAQAAFIADALKRRIQGQPLQYILGKTEFMGLEFKVTPEVLIPRPETELLVETTIRLRSRLRPRLRILEIGTGSGCIAVSLAKLLPQANITATDISPQALAVAKENAILNKVDDKISFIHADLFSTYDLPACRPGKRLTTYDLIISNPPYIPSVEIGKLQPEVKQEPVVALDGGRDGLDFYRRIISGAADHLAPQGLLMLEMGFGQCDSVKKIFALYPEYEIMEVIKDYNQIERIILARKKG